MFKVQSESDSMWARASPPGFPVTYHFSISLTCGFSFRHACPSFGTLTHLDLLNKCTRFFQVIYPSKNKANL